ncbi:MAG: VOC family protein [Candidatus Daviesbacteria bacterium]|nr:VOC family protein [Candidatus Daviesbacteria bacterium]
MNKLLKIDNIMYFVEDLDKSAAFYSEILGLTQRWRDDEHQMIGFTFDQSDSEVVIHSNSNLPKFDFSFLVEDVVSFCNEIKEKRYEVLEEPFDVRTGKFAVLSDPDGNKIPIIDLTKFGGKPKYD